MQIITKQREDTRYDVSVSTLPGIMKCYPIKFRHYKN